METWSDAGDDIIHPNLHPKKKTSNRTLIQKIETILASYEMQEKYLTKINQNSLDIISELIKTKPEYFRMVESTLIRNINNDKIDAQDIPYIITIISHLYNLLLITNMNNLKSNDHTIDTCSNILKFIFSVSIRESLVVIDDDTNATLLLLCFDNIVDACIKLLKVSLSKPFTLLTENVNNENNEKNAKIAPKTPKKNCYACFRPCCYCD